MKKNNKDKKPVQQILLPNYILFTGKILNKISPYLASRFAAKLFLRPLKYKLPKREQKMDRESKQEKLLLPESGKEIITYKYGNSQKKILLVHGWSGRGTQLAVIAEALLERGYSSISFDAPGHGKAAGNMSMMPYFVEAIHLLYEKHGPFEAAIGHSLGGMSCLRAVKDGVSLNKLVIIGTANSVTQITREFVQNLQLDKEVAKRMKTYFDAEFGEDMDNYSGAVSAAGVKIPTLVIHDTEDVDVHVSSAYEIKEALSNGEIYITEGLGHRRILGDEKVMEKILEFIAN